MQVVLKVVGGKNDGREIKISVPRFIIGRGETANLRPTSDLVSREHCAIELKNGKVILADLNSRNGTYINGEKLNGSHLVRSGDSLRIGRLQFQILVDPVKASAKKPKVESVIDAAARTASQKKSSLEDSIADWLTDDGEDGGLGMTNPSTDTVQLNLDDTSVFGAPTKAQPKEAQPEEVQTQEEAIEQSGDLEGVADEDEKKKKSKPKKLPKAPKFQHESSMTAADDVLRKFFNRR